MATRGPQPPGQGDPEMTSTDTKGNQPEHMFDQRVDSSPAENPRPLPWLCRVIGHRWTPVLNPKVGWGEPVMVSVCGRCGCKP